MALVRKEYKYSALSFGDIAMGDVVFRHLSHEAGKVSKVYSHTSGMLMWLPAGTHARCRDMVLSLRSAAVRRAQGNVANNVGRATLLRSRQRRHGSPLIVKPIRSPTSSPNTRPCPRRIPGHVVVGWLP